jgi:hypothetical protein
LGTTGDTAKESIAQDGALSKKAKEALDFSKIKKIKKFKTVCDDDHHLCFIDDGCLDVVFVFRKYYWRIYF